MKKNIMNGTLLAITCIGMAGAGELSRGGYFPYFVDGGGWSTTFVMTCFSSPQCDFQFNLLASAVNPTPGGGPGPLVTVPLRITVADPQQPEVQVTVSENRLNFTLKTGMSAIIETLGTRADIASGIVDVLSTTTLGGLATLRQHVPDRLDFEASVSMESRNFANSFAIPFDNRNGYALGVSLVNITNDRSANVVVTGTDLGGGSLFTTSISLAALNSVAFNVAAQFPQTAGKAGLLRFSAGTAFISGAGFRFNPTGGLSTVPILNVR